MQGRKGQNSNPSIENFRPENLRKIMPSDRFPCFSCFDHPKDKLECKECRGNGWVHGSHPMVQFAQDFIQKKMGGLIHSQMGNSLGFDSEMGDSNVRMSLSEEPYKRGRETFPGSLRQTAGFKEQLGQSRRFQDEDYLDQQYYCDECTSKDPIRGKRYHCKECEDYDLCENCFVCGMHTHHQMQEHLPFKRPDNQTLLAENERITLVRKSIKFPNRS